MTGLTAAERRQGREPSRLGRILGWLLLVLAGCLLVAATGLTYGLTSEYGYSPNDDPAGDLRRAVLGHGLTSLLVAGLVAGGLALATPLRRRRRRACAAAVLVVAFLVLALGTAWGQRTLDQRCAGSERSSTGAC